MADDAPNPGEPRGPAAHIQSSSPREDDTDPSLGALGYEAADPALQARLWGEPSAELKA